jgi:hypothetical protein
MDIPQNIKNEIWDYCRLNNITNMDQFVINMLIQGLNIEKYGTSPIVPQVIEKEVIKEIEKIVEVPIEKIVEKIVEVPVEKIIEKVITDNSQVGELLTKIEELNKELKIEKEKTSNSELGKLYQKISNLESLLEVEKNRSKPKIEITNPFNDKPKDVIKWIPQEKDKKDLYDE